MINRLIMASLILTVGAAYAGGQDPPAEDAAQLLRSAAHKLGADGKAAPPDAAPPAHWEAVHAVEGDGLMLHGVAQDVCSAAETQTVRTDVRLQASCHRDGPASTLIVFLAQ